MYRYLLKRAVQALITLWLASLVVFLLGRLTGDPVALLLSETSTKDDQALLAAQLGLDRPLPEQYVIFAAHAVRGDLGRSIRGDRTPALDLVLERLPASLELAALALVVSLLVGLPLGVASALRQGSLLDTLIRLLAMVGQAAPAFWLGIVGMYFLSVQLRLLPSSGYGRLEQFVLPGATIGAFALAAIVRLTRASMLEILPSEYIKFARCKGLAERAVIWKHALRNSLIPILTYAGTLLGRLTAGVVVVETVFAWPGIGRLAYEAVLARDFPVLQAVVLVVAALFLAINLIVDILYAFCDPRIKYA